MHARSPYVDADGAVSLVPSSLHNAGSGVEELADLVLNTRDITRLDELIESRLMEWWVGVAGVPATFGERASLLNLYMTLVLPAAWAVSSDPDEIQRLQSATEASDPMAVPDIDVLLHPDAVARALGVHSPRV